MAHGRHTCVTGEERVRWSPRCGDIPHARDLYVAHRRAASLSPGERAAVRLSAARPVEDHGASQPRVQVGRWQDDSLRRLPAGADVVPVVITCNIGTTDMRQWPGYVGWGEVTAAAGLASVHYNHQLRVLTFVAAANRLSDWSTSEPGVAYWLSTCIPRGIWGRVLGIRKVRRARSWSTALPSHE